LTLTLLKWNQLPKYLSFALHTITYIDEIRKCVTKAEKKFIRKYGIIFWLVHIRPGKSNHELHVIFPVLRAQAIMRIFIFLNLVDISYFSVMLDKKQQTHHVKTYVHWSGSLARYQNTYKKKPMLKIWRK